MPLHTEQEHCQLWCPEARIVVVDFGGPRVATGIKAGQVEASPPLNRMDFGPNGGLKVPSSSLCFGSQCGAWQWSHWVRGADGKNYQHRSEAPENALPVVQIGYCGKAAPKSKDMVPQVKVTPPAANDVQPPAEGTPQGETIQ